MQKVLTIQDLSCLGKCALTVALPVLSAMGCSCTVLPTAVFSTHTAFPAPHVRQLTEDLLPTARHWQSVGAAFDTISIGYLSGPEQAEVVSAVLELFPATVVLDPVMGDHGKLYSRITPEQVQAMQALCRKADFLLPNLTEAAALTGLPYRECADAGYLAELTEGLLEFGAKAVIITGIGWDENTTGIAGADRNGAPLDYRSPRLPGSQHGTGDLFSAVFAGALTRGKDVLSSATLAARFVEQVLSASPVRSPFGAEFEVQLPWLWEQL